MHRRPESRVLGLYPRAARGAVTARSFDVAVHVILQVAVRLSSITTGATFGLFLLGLFVPWAETVGAMTGAVLSLCLMTFVCIGGFYAKKSGAISYPPLPTRIDGCK